MNERKVQLQRKGGVGRQRRSQTSEADIALTPGSPEHCLEELRRTSHALFPWIGRIQNLLQKEPELETIETNDFDLIDLGKEILSIQSNFFASFIAPNPTRENRRQANLLTIVKNIIQEHLDSLDPPESKRIKLLIDSDCNNFPHDQELILLFNPYYIVGQSLKTGTLQQQFQKQKAMAIIPSIFSLHPELQSVFKEMPHLLETQTVLKRDMLDGKTQRATQGLLKQRVTAIAPKNCELKDSKAFTAWALDTMLMHLSSIQRECVWIIRSFQDALFIMITKAIPVMQKSIKFIIDQKALVQQITNNIEWWEDSPYSELCQQLIPPREYEVELCRNEVNADNLQIHINLLLSRLQLAMVDIGTVCSTFKGDSPIFGVGLKFITACTRLKDSLVNINKINQPDQLIEKSGFFYAYSKSSNEFQAICTDQTLPKSPLPSLAPVNALEVIARSTTAPRKSTNLLKQSIRRSMDLSGQNDGESPTNSPTPSPSPSPTPTADTIADDCSSEAESDFKFK